MDRERLIIKGLIVEKEAQLKRDTIEIENSAEILRVKAYPLEGIESIDVDAVFVQAQNLKTRMETYKRLKADIVDLKGRIGE
jgi:hypothetical protein